MCATCWPYLVVAGDALVHDVVEVHQEVAVGQHVLVSGHHLADELVSLQLAGLVLSRQHGGLYIDYASSGTSRHKLAIMGRFHNHQISTKKSILDLSLYCLSLQHPF